jgi:hypothetical protein
MYPNDALELNPRPPKSQMFPSASVHEFAASRPPGVLLADAAPSAPYVPLWLVELEPDFQVHIFVVPGLEELPHPADVKNAMTANSNAHNRIQLFIEGPHC